MTPVELRTELARLGVTYPDPNETLRACLYLQELQTTYDFFHTTLDDTINNGGLGPGYAQVRQALGDSELLNSLSKALDRFIVPAIDRDLNTRTNITATSFTAYYLQYVLTNNYPADRTAYLNLYPVTRDLIARIGNNFRSNIKEACRRILADWNTIQAVFVNDPTARLQALTRIGSSGSDFHKGGKQVLILSFDVRYLVVNRVISIPAHKTLNIIYKPSDLEADCLLAGNSAAVNAVHNNFQTASLFELMNTAIQTAKQNNALLELETLPVYKILPMVYGSSAAAGANPVPVRDAYGYIEFLEHIFSQGIWIPYFNYYPFGASDFKIFPRQDQAAICRRFYRIIGQMTALASTFSIIDLHMENLIVRNYTPHLIDLEICLATLINSVDDTLLFGSFAAVTGTTVPHGKRYTEVFDNGRLKINQTPISGYEKNRLWTVDPPAVIDPVQYAAPFCRSLRDMVGVVQTVYNAGTLDPWRDRVLNAGQGVVVRYLPLGTGGFAALLDGASNNVYCSNPAALAGIVSIQRGVMYNEWISPQPPLDPEFLALQDAYVIADYLNADIPIFYHRIGSLDLVDSRGIPVAVPGSITYLPGMGQQPVQANTNLGRNSYFAVSPFINRIFTTQLTTISVNGNRDTRVHTLVGQILGNFKLANAANDITTILA